jgi:hypothetical protein
MNLSVGETIVGSKAAEDRRCCHCGGRPKLVYKMLDTRSGCTVRMFECACGERIWIEDHD